MAHKRTQFPNSDESEGAASRLWVEIFWNFIPARLTQLEDNGHWTVLQITTFLFLFMVRRLQKLQAVRKQ